MLQIKSNPLDENLGPPSAVMTSVLVQEWGTADTEKGNEH